MIGASVLAQSLRDHGVRYVFGLPGTQNATFYSELCRAGLTPVPSMHEMGAGFAGLGYAATSNQPAVLALIGGPGFSYAITPMLEALLDSIPMVILVFAWRSHSGRHFGAQEIDHKRLAESCCKKVFVPTRDEEVLPMWIQALDLSQQGEPGPVTVLIEAEFLSRELSSSKSAGITLTPTPKPEAGDVAQLMAALDAAQRPVFIAGRGALGAADSFRELAERFQAPVMTSTSARGIIPENHPLSLSIDLVDVKVVNALLAESDRIFAWGIKFSHNSAKRFALHLPGDKLVHVDAADHVLNANFVSGQSHLTDVPQMLRALAMASAGRAAAEPRFDLEKWRARFAAAAPSLKMHHISGVTPANPKGFFAGLRELLADDAILVLDSGFHQNLARALFTVRSPHGLLLPTGLQSMGFAVPAGMGAALAAPQRPVVVLIGDGGLRMCGMDLLSAVQARCPLVLIVFDDGYYEIIRQMQLQTTGAIAGVTLAPMDYEAWTLSLGARYFDGADNPIGAIQSAMQSGEPCLVQVTLSDTWSSRASRWKARLTARVRRLLKR